MATLVTGIASTPHIDAERHSVLPGAFTLTHSVPLLWRHDQAHQCGEIIRLWQDAERVMITARVDSDALAKFARGFSVSFSVDAYQIKNRGEPNYYAEVSRATLSEVSLTPNPANADCVILHREPYADLTEGYRKAMATRTDLSIRAISIIQEKLQLCRVLSNL